MTITWKTKDSLKPEIILGRIDAIRTISPTGGSSFSGYDLDDALPALQSMLNFPPGADNIGKSTLVWKAVCSAPEKLTPDTFKTAINKIFRESNATKEAGYHILTSLSFSPNGFNRRASIDGATLRLLDGEYPKKFGCRTEIITRAKIPVDHTPSSYTRVIVSVRARSPKGAITKGLRIIDLYRAIFSLYCNAEIEIRGKEWVPINVIRLGGAHTVHTDQGKVATEVVWFEPNYTEARLYSPPKAQVDILQGNFALILRRLHRAKYDAILSDALLRYVRALDESDQNSAFIKLWGAIEALIKPGLGNNDLVVRRCSFLFSDTQYHKQILEHLRERRNNTVHAGDQNEDAKTLCFQMQYYFKKLFFFHISNAYEFSTIDEANTFLDHSPNKTELMKQKRMLQKAIRFVS